MHILLCTCDFIFVSWTIIDNEHIKLEKGSRHYSQGDSG